ncbi:MAG TPA: DUF362 domain-containing protein [Anaerolineales bacterium]|nr:DUF362 domain-containing protein [Anaerolineales bacterium]
MKQNISRRDFLRVMALATGAFLAGCQKIIPLTPTANQTAQPTQAPIPTTETPVVKNLAAVYMTTAISAAGLLKIYQTLGRAAQGRVAVKISSGEPGGHHFLSPDLIAPLVKEVNGTIVECNTAYGGGRANTAAHERVMEAHGFAAIAPVDIMDADGTMNLPITGGKHLKEDVVGSHFANYDFMLNLAHFKGHAMGGFGGVIKNMSIGIASTAGKCLIHTAGASSTSPWGGDQDSFLESMAEAAKGVADYLGENILYINVMNNLSVDCDCDSSPAAPTMKDIGILASLDPVALDQACVDLVYAAPDSKDLIARMESLNGIHTLEHGEAIGLGSRKYELISID